MDYLQKLPWKVTHSTLCTLFLYEVTHQLDLLTLQTHCSRRINTATIFTFVANPSNCNLFVFKIQRDRNWIGFVHDSPAIKRVSKRKLAFDVRFFPRSLWNHKPPDIVNLLQLFTCFSHTCINRIFSFPYFSFHRVIHSTIFYSVNNDLSINPHLLGMQEYRNKQTKIEQVNTNSHYCTHH